MLGFPKIEDISYMHLRAAQANTASNHQESSTVGGVLSSKAYIELQRKVAKLEAKNKKQS